MIYKIQCNNCHDERGLFAPIMTPVRIVTQGNNWATVEYCCPTCNVSEYIGLQIQLSDLHDMFLS